MGISFELKTKKSTKKNQKKKVNTIINNQVPNQKKNKHSNINYKSTQSPSIEREKQRREEERRTQELIFLRFQSPRTDRGDTVRPFFLDPIKLYAPSLKIKLI